MKKFIVFTMGFVIGYLLNRTDKPKQFRGFATMDKEKRREIARLGGIAAQQSGNGHRWDSEEAKEAGRKGGMSISQDAEHMATIGREGGRRSKRRSKAKRQEAINHG